MKLMVQAKSKYGKKEKVQIFGPESGKILFLSSSKIQIKSCACCTAEIENHSVSDEGESFYDTSSRGKTMKKIPGQYLDQEVSIFVVDMVYYLMPAMIW